MKLNKLYLIVATSATLLSTNAYAWHNEITKNFKICNETGVPVKVAIESPQNVKLEVPSGNGINTKWEFPLKIGECGTMKVSHDWNTHDITKFRLAIFRQDSQAGGSSNFAVDVRSYTTDRNETRTSNGGGNKINVFSVHNPHQKNGWNILAPIKQSYVYLHKYTSGCDGNGCYYHRWWGFKNHDAGLIGLKNFADGAGLSLLFSPSNTQTLYLVSEPDGKKDELDQVISHEVYDNFAKLTETEKQQSVKTIDGYEINMKEFPNFKLCQVYQPEYTLEQMPSISISNLKMQEIAPKLSDPFIATNNHSGAQKVNTTEITVQNTKTQSTTILSGWKAGATVKISGKFSVPGKEKGFEVSGSYEYNASKTEMNTTTETITNRIPSQTIDIPPKSFVEYQAKLSQVSQSGDFKAQYNLNNLTLRAKAAFYGNCNDTGYVSINPYPIFSSPNAVLDTGIAVNPENKKVALTISGNFNGVLGNKTELVFGKPQPLNANGTPNLKANPKDFIKPLN